MKAKAICLLAVLTIITTFFLSCSKDSPTGILNNVNFKYPFTIGSTWSYTEVISLGNVRPDSIKYKIDTTTRISTSIITITHDTTINGAQTRCFAETFTQGTTNWYSRAYYANSDSGLFRYGFTYSGGGLYLPSGPSSNIKFLYNGILYNDPMEIIISLGKFSNPTNMSADTVPIILDNPPANCIKYPIILGTEWFFKRYDNNLYVNKKYIGYENILVNNNMISCVKTELKVYGSVSSSTDYLYDYHSEYGQMKRDYYFKDVIFTNELGISIGLMDIRHVVDVTSYNIVDP